MAGGRGGASGNPAAIRNLTRRRRLLKADMKRVLAERDARKAAWEAKHRGRKKGGATPAFRESRMVTSSALHGHAQSFKSTTELVRALKQELRLVTAKWAATKLQAGYRMFACYRDYQVVVRTKRGPAAVPRPGVADVDTCKIPTVHFFSQTQPSTAVGRLARLPALHEAAKKGDLDGLKRCPQGSALPF